MSHFSKQEDFKINQSLEEQRFLLAEKKMQMIQLQAKIDALGVFNSNLKCLKYNKKKTTFNLCLNNFQFQ